MQVGTHAGRQAQPPTRLRVSSETVASNTTVTKGPLWLQINVERVGESSSSVMTIFLGIFNLFLLQTPAIEQIDSQFASCERQNAGD